MNADEIREMQAKVCDKEIKEIEELILKEAKKIPIVKAIKVPFEFKNINHYFIAKSYFEKRGFKVDLFGGVIISW